jgi:TetR/AcrR family transcriptional regulator, cholesterol catabolism regulator
MSQVEKEGDRRKEIIEASIELFYEYGYQKASLRDIARRVGITQAAIYYHFKNKEEILLTIIDKYSNELYFTLKSCFSQKKNPIENLRDAIFHHAVAIRSSRSGAKIIIEDKRFLGDELKNIVREKERLIYRLYKDYLQQLQDSGLVREECDLKVATFGILGMINWLYHWYNPDKKMTIERIAEQIIDNLFLGLMKK